GRNRHAFFAAPGPQRERRRPARPRTLAALLPPAAPTQPSFVAAVHGAERPRQRRLRLRGGFLKSGAEPGAGLAVEQRPTRGSASASSVSSTDEAATSSASVPA